MKLASLKLAHFRNYEAMTIDNLSNVNILLGDNAQGKTNFLEAIYLLALGKSFRTNHDSELIESGAEEALVEGSFTRDTQSEIKLGLKIKKRGKIAYLNQLEQPRMSDFVGAINTVIFSPEDLNIVKGAPSYRRHYLDLELSSISPKYLNELRRYQRTLKQKNQYLKMMREGKSNDSIYLDVLNHDLAEAGGYLAWARSENIAELEQYATDIHYRLTQKKEKLEIVYLSEISCDALNSPEDAASALLASFERLSERELRQGVTIAGIQHDDLSFMVNGTNVASFGSQGQKRSVSISLKLSEIEVIKKIRHEAPILLLDDIFSELDQNRQTFLIKSFEQAVQIFITTTSINDIDTSIIEPPLIIKVDDGRISSRGKNG
ncbi:DNA replication and repair protein RecF [Xylocopilactobacillus apicola]|uniref:DNA replication and repair protein RecF n=2 Tax=Xylocopilactobacillus apicola TaxID=2932184 RepID=A0AAU9D2F1_9LACO|nr:DNA replication and repair protein RecF [Xylocopilactobacillus apicola]